MKTLTTKAAWRLIAREFEKVANGASALPGGFAACGLCAAVSDLFFRYRITYEQREAMHNEIQRTLNENNQTETGVLWRYDADGAAHRAILATLFAESSVG